MILKNNILAAAFILLASVFLFSCEKDDETANISRVTTYPLISLKGEEWVPLLQGGSFTDPGVDATIGGEPVEVEVTGAPNTSVPGVYVITYTATNEDGFSASVTRKVGVIAPAAAAMDLTGKYKRNAGVGGISTITKLGPGFYQSDNAGGVADPGPESTVKFFHYEGNKIYGPPQDVQGTTFSVIDGTVTPGVSYTWTVIASGYGDAPRTFVKQ